MRRALSIELRRGVGIWTALPLALALVATALAHPRDWAGDWYGWGYYLRVSLIVLGPLVVATAAWQGGRERRRGLTELVGSVSRSPLQQVLASLVSPAVWSLAAFVGVAAAMAAVTAQHASYGSPSVPVAGSAAAAVALFAALGFAVGRVSPWRATAPVLAVTTYVVLGAANYSSPIPLSPSVELLSPEVPVGWWAPACAAAYLALGAAAVLALGSRSRLLVVPFMIAAFLAARPVWQMGDDALTLDTASQRLVCSGGTPRVCLTRLHADQLDEVTRTVRTEFSGILSRRAVVEQHFDHGPPYPDNTLNPLYVGADVLGHSDLAVVRQDVAAQLVQWGCGHGGAPPDDQELSGATYEMEMWVADRSEPRTGVLRGLTDAQALSLVNRFAVMAAHCDREAARTLLRDAR